MLVALKKGAFGPGRYVFGKLVFERLNSGQTNTVHEVDDDTGAVLVNTGHFEIRATETKKPMVPPARGDRPASSRAKAAEAFPVFDDEPDAVETHEAPETEKPVAFTDDEPVAQPALPEAGNPIPPSANLEEMTFGELVGYAKSRGIKLTRDMKKAAVVNAILGSK